MGVCEGFLTWSSGSTGVSRPIRMNRMILRVYEECVFNFCRSQAWNDGGLFLSDVALHLAHIQGIKYSHAQRVVKRLLDSEILVTYSSGEVYIHAELLELP